MKLAAGNPVIEIIKLGYQADKPVLLIGGHGCGKSSSFQEAARVLGIEAIVRDLSLMEPPDLIGIPQINDGETRYAVPSFLPRNGKGIIVFEELNRCAPYMRTSCLELLTARRLNDYKLPIGWVPMAAINPSSGDYIDAEELDPALLSRFLRIEVSPSVEEWSRWARGHQVHEKIIEFVEQSPGAFDSGEASPRCWTYASDLLKTWEGGKRDHDVLAVALAGTIGDNWALAFLRYFGDASRPLSAAEIINDYPAQRAVLRRWTADAKLDLVVASLEVLKRHMQPQRKYKEVVDNAQKKANIESFFSDLPPDLKRQVTSWLKERGFTKLSVPRRTKK